MDLNQDHSVKKRKLEISKYAITEKPPKTENSYRILKIPMEVLDELAKRKMQIDELKNSVLFIDEYDYVSCRFNGLPHSVSAMNIALNKICDRNELSHISPHRLRHNYTTILLEIGVEIAKISALLGHESVNTTFEYYCDVMEGQNSIITFMNDNFKIQEVK